MAERWGNLFEPPKTNTCSKCRQTTSDILPVDTRILTRAYLCRPCWQRYLAYMADYYMKLHSYEEAIMYTNQYRRRLYNTIVFYSTVLILLLVVIPACGEDLCTEPGVHIQGPAIMEDIETLSIVLDAMQDSGIGEPACTVVVFLYDSDHAKSILPTSPKAGRTDNLVRGMCRRHDDGRRTVYIRRYGDAEPYCMSLLVHELVHAIGYDHGEVMKEVERKIWDVINA